MAEGHPRIMTPPAPHGLAYRPPASGMRGVVSSAHGLASMAGIEMLLEGGNAADAAVATAAALGVVEFYRSGLGGVGIALVSSQRSGERAVIDFTGATPLGAEPERVTHCDLEFGAKACLTPAALAGWLALLDRFGTMPRQRVFAPAIRLAEEGFPLTPRTVEFLRVAAPRLACSDEGQRLLQPARTPRPGGVLVQKDLARTLREVAEGGLSVLYDGPIGRRITMAVEARGGWLGHADLANCRAEWQEPLLGSFRGIELAVPPPPCTGWQVLETLHILEGFDLNDLGHNSPEYLHLFIEAAKLASADRLEYAHRALASVRKLMSKNYAAAQRGRVDRRRAAVSGGERFERERLGNQLDSGSLAHLGRLEETTHFAAADGDLAISITASLGNMFGSGFMAPGTGVFLNNFLAWTDLESESPNRLSAGEKIQLMLTPVQGFRQGRFALSIGTPGSYGILQTTPQMVLNHLEFGMDVQETVEAPRVCARRGRVVDVEGRVPDTTRTALVALGHEIHSLDEDGGWSWQLGGAHCITRDGNSGALAGGADPRRDGHALAI